MNTVIVATFARIHLRTQVPTRGQFSRAADNPLRLAVAGYLARYRGMSRAHAESDLMLPATGRHRLKLHRNSGGLMLVAAESLA